MISGSFILGLLENLIALYELTIVSYHSLHANFKHAVTDAHLGLFRGSFSSALVHSTLQGPVVGHPQYEEWQVQTITEVYFIEGFYLYM